MQSAIEPIAIIGLDGRFPGAPDLAAFWANLRAGVESIRFFSRAELEAAGVEPVALDHPNYVPAKGALADIERFDAEFFGFTPREAQYMDPQHRIFLECGWAALENAGYDPERYAGLIGVYAGESMNTYLLASLGVDPHAVWAMGTDKDFLTTRLSYRLNLRGPSIVVQTACSTSLVAVCLACQGLWTWQCDMALAGGICINVPAVSGYLHQPGSIHSPDGHCRPFDASAAGTVGGSGVGLLVLKRLSEALADGDTIHAVIRGVGLNNDGAAKIGYTAPSISGQAQAIALAQMMGDIDPATVTYIEAHGTGTRLGDPIEIAALTRAFRAGTSATGYCAVGSVKSNIGHLDAAAGVAGLIKTVLALRNRELPPSLHFQRPNPEIDFAGSPFFVNDALRPWTPPPGVPRRAGVSSFGIGGTNAHVVVEEAPQAAPTDAGRPWLLLPLSARSSAALATAAQNLALHIEQQPDLSLADCAWTVQIGRKPFPYRRVVIGRERDELLTALRAEPVAGLTQLAPEAPPRIGFLFPGQGAQYPNMGRGLYEHEPSYRATIDHCVEILARCGAADLRDCLLPLGPDSDAAADRLTGPRAAQVSLFVVEYALAQLWRSWGIQPAALLGHSAGEYVAACVSGVLALEDALRVIELRGRLMERAPAGAMLAVLAAEADIRPYLTDGLSVAAINAPGVCTLSGPTDGIAAAEQALRNAGIGCQRLRTGGAYHSRLMDTVVEPLSAALAETHFGQPQIPYVGNVSGSWITAAELGDPRYWGRHVRQTVRFADGVATLRAAGIDVFLEVGPGQTLTGFVNRAAGSGTCITSLRGARDATDDGESLTRALGRLWLAGTQPDWAAYHAGQRRRRVPLPTYPFERQRYWIDRRPGPRRAAPPAATLTPSNGSTVMNEWLLQPAWKPAAPPAAGAPPANPQVVVFTEAAGFAAALAAQLGAASPLLVVSPGTGPAPDGAGRRVRPGERPDYVALLRELKSAQGLPGTIIHAWALAGDAPPTTPAEVERLQAQGFDSLVALAQALGEVGLAHEIRIIVATQDLYRVTGQEMPRPEQALAFGPSRVIPQEYPELRLRHVDLDAATARDPAAAARVLLDELRAPAGEPTIAVRAGQRYTLAPEPAQLDADPAGGVPLRTRGTYLITGGLGGIGLELAKALAASHQAQLVLVGRTPVPARDEWPHRLAAAGPGDPLRQRLEALAEIERSGGATLTFAADVADEAQLRDILAAATARFGPLNGVIHSAGVAGGGMLQLKTAAAAAAVLRPKVAGTLALARVLADQPLDFFVLCSSLTALVGGGGQVDYCAANAFQDAFAHQQFGAGRRVLAINWDAWTEVGMAVNTPLPPQLAKQRELGLRHAIKPAEGVEIFRRALAAPPRPQLIVRNTRALREASGAAAAPADTPPAQPTMHPRPALRTEFVPPADDTERRIAEVWEAALGIQGVGVLDSFFDLGGQSYLAVGVIGRINQLFSTDLPVAAVYEALTIRGLAERVRGGGGPPAAGAAGDPDQQRARLDRRREHQERRRAARRDTKGVQS